MGMNKKLIIIFFLTINAFVCGQSKISENNPDRIVLNLTENPATSIAITWRTVKESVEPKVEISKSTQWTDFVKSTVTHNAVKQKFVTDRSDVVYHYSVVIDNLTPATNYVYRVGSDSVWSEWNQFTTADLIKSPFKFVFLGDPQDDLKEHCSRVFREAFKKAPDAKFWLIGGDLVTNPQDNLWEEFFYAAGFIFRTMPIIAAPGNHDHLVIDAYGKQKPSKEIASTWTSHFTLPENGLGDLKETNYYIDYQGVRFVVINSQVKVVEQASWLDGLLSDNPNKWTIVCFHHPIYSATSERNDKTTREAFQPIFDKYNVELVLNGHDHTYARSKMIKYGKPVAPGEKGTTYVVSVSGPKAYPLNDKFDDLMVKTGNELQLYQVIELNENKIFYKAYTVDGNLFDSFELTK